MKSIYEHADKVIVWLGPRKNDSDRAMDLLNTIATLELDSLTVDAKHLILDKVFDRIKRDRRSSYALCKLLHRSWWERAWIIQEVTGPTSDPISIWCGKKRINFNKVVIAHMSLERAIPSNPLSKFPSITNRTMIDLAIIMFIRKHPQMKDPLDLLQLLRLTYGFDTTDPRDNIYSILGVAVDGVHEDLRPDYSLPVEHVYTRLAKRLINRDKKLEILAYCFQEKNFSVPSWVPDWSFRDLPIPLLRRAWVRRDTEDTAYNASNGYLADPLFIDEDQVLAVKGLVFDEIIKVSLARVWYEDDDIPKDADLAKSWISFALDAMESDSYVSGGTNAEALSKTLCAEIDDRIEARAKGGNMDNTHPPSILTGDRNSISSNFFASYRYIHRTSYTRRLMRTKTGFLGITSMYTEPGDFVCILFGSSVPIVLRKLDKYWAVISECYVHGIMDGEAVRDSPEDIITFELR